VKRKADWVSSSDPRGERIKGKPRRGIEKKHMAIPLISNFGTKNRKKV